MARLIPAEAKLNHKLVFIADVLGFTDAVRTNTSLSGSQATLDRFSNLVDDAVNALSKHRPEGRNKQRTWNVRTYTDNFLLETRLQKGGRDDLLNAFRAVAAFQYAIVQHGFVSRGAMSIGYNYTKNHVVFGQALIEAHDLESKVANTPRVIMSNAVRRLAARHFMDERFENESEQTPSPLLEDHDGQWFVNYLTETLARDAHNTWCIDRAMLAFHRDLVQSNLENSKHDHQVRQKYLWAAIYHNWFVSRYERNGRHHLRVDLSDAIIPMVPRELRVESIHRMERSFKLRVRDGDDIWRHAVRIAARDKRSPTGPSKRVL